MKTEYLIHFRGVFDKAVFTQACSNMFIDTDVRIKYESPLFCQLSISKYKQSYIAQLFDKLHNSKVVIKTTHKKRTKYTLLKDFTCQ